MPPSAARVAAFDILLRVEQQDAYASELLHSGRVDKLSAADRGLTTEIVMGVLRWQSRLDGAIATKSARPLAKLDAEVRVALRVAAYQLLFLTRVPASAAINDSVELVKRARKTSAAPFANAVLRKLTKAEPAESSNASATAAQRLAQEFAHPEWLVLRWVAQYGIENAEALCRHNQHVPPTCIRIDSEQIAQELENDGVQLAPGALLTSARTITGGDVARTRAYRQGRVFIQDEASQLVAALVGTGSRILDCCAAPGSKTAALAARSPSAEIVAVELHPHRAELLRTRVRANNVRVLTADALHLPLTGQFDRVLVDVPCSGTGTLGRNPEIKWRLKGDDLPELHEKQVAILQSALQQLAPGGRAIYSTCSLEAEENQAVVGEVVGSHANITVLDCRSELKRLRSMGELAWSNIDSLLEGPFIRTIPGIHPCDGFFAAVLQRDGE